MKRSRSIGIVCVLAAMLLAVSGAYVLGHRRGSREGVRSGALSATSIQSQRRLVALQLLKSGQVGAGIARMDHYLDQDVVTLGTALPELEDRGLKREYLRKVKEFRREFPRAPYEGKWADAQLPDQADQLLRECVD